MRTFTKGILIGIGVGFILAPMKGDEMRRLLSERFAELRSSLPENGQLNQYIGQVSSRVSTTGDTLLGYAQQAVSRVKDTGNALGDLAQQSVREVKQTGQDVADQTKQTVKSSGTTKVIPDDML